MEVQFSEHFQRSFKKLDKSSREGVLEAVKILSDLPKAGKKLRGRLSAYYSLRVGKYRVIYSVETNAVRLHDIGHRQNVYG
ncbi:MAG: type II toxin-antitoxin system RelE/ParE family toxin [Candidatus Micrarchaeota archaeon]